MASRTPAGASAPNEDSAGRRRESPTEAAPVNDEQPHDQVVDWFAEDYLPNVTIGSLIEQKGETEADRLTRRFSVTRRLEDADARRRGRAGRNRY